MAQTGDEPSFRRATLGAFLIFYAMLCFGSLPLLLKVLIVEIDPITLTWYRFFFAGLSIAIVSGFDGVRRFKAAVGNPSIRWILLGAGLGLSANYTLYMSGLGYLTPGTAQIVLQLSPFFVIFGGVFLYREIFTRRQWLGVLLLVIGCGLFFNERLDQFRSLSSAFATGAGLIVLAAVAWAIFVLLQKRLVQTIDARTTMIGCYATGAIVFAAVVNHGKIWQLDARMAAILVFCIAVTATSYLAFTSSLRHLKAATAGIAMANIPLVTLAGSLAIGPYVDRLPPENLNTLALIGAGIVVIGSILGALPSKTEPRQTPV